MDEEELEVVRRGQVASIIKNDIGTYLSKERDGIINNLVNGFKDRSLTTERIWGFIGGLHALQALESQLNSDIRSGRRKSNG